MMQSFRIATHSPYFLPTFVSVVWIIHTVEYEQRGFNILTAYVILFSLLVFYISKRSRCIAGHGWHQLHHAHPVGWKSGHHVPHWQTQGTGRERLETNMFWIRGLTVSTAWILDFDNVTCKEPHHKKVLTSSGGRGLLKHKIINNSRSSQGANSFNKVPLDLQAWIVVVCVSNKVPHRIHPILACRGKRSGCEKGDWSQAADYDCWPEFRERRWTIHQRWLYCGCEYKQFLG